MGRKDPDEIYAEVGDGCSVESLGWEPSWKPFIGREITGIAPVLYPACIKDEYIFKEEGLFWNPEKQDFTPNPPALMYYLRLDFDNGRSVYLSKGYYKPGKIHSNGSITPRKFMNNGHKLAINFSEEKALEHGFGEPINRYHTPNYFSQ